MRTLKKVGLMAVVLLSGASCGASTQLAPSAQPAASSCNGLSDLEQQVAQVYDATRVRRVSPLYAKRFLARAIQPRYVEGAELYIDAEAGVSQPYLQRVLTCYAASGSAAHPNDPLAAQNIQSVRVRAQGPHFVIAVTSSARGAGTEIWHRAKALVQPTSRVEVKQLSESEGSLGEL